MTLNKKLVATAVGAALTVGLGMQAAQADNELLFPYVRKEANITTVITIMGGAPAAGTTLKVQYWTKSTTAANTAACEPNSRDVPFTNNDMVTWDTGGLLGASFPVFGDTTNGVFNPEIAFAGPRHGYLVVKWNGVDGGTGKGPWGGYWLEVDVANANAHGDSAAHIPINDAGDGISDAMQLQNNDARAVNFWPPMPTALLTPAVSTVFTVTPLNANMETIENNNVVMHVVQTTGLQGAYGRVENPLDGSVVQSVRCVARLTPAALMPGVVLSAPFPTTGGWGMLRNRGDGDVTLAEACGIAAGVGTGDCGAMVYQVDTSSALGGRFMSDAVRLATDWGNGYDTAGLLATP